MESILIYLIKSSAILSLFYITHYLFLKKETLFMFNRIYLLFGLLVSTILPLVYITKTITLKISTKETVTVDPINTLETHTTFFSWSSFLLLMYTLGVALFIYRLIIEGRQLRGIIKKGQAESYEEYTYIVSNKSISPFSFFKWIVYNPELHYDN